MSNDVRVPLIGVCRHRLGIDGNGVVTLVAFHGCTLSCRYCLNRECLRADGVFKTATPEELLREVMPDNLYFLASGGGITFGGGEPCLRSVFIENFCRMMPAEWNVTLETALNVEWHHVERLLPYVDRYYIDIKDLDADIYERYTSQSPGRMLSNLRRLLSHEGMAEKVVVRLPHIPGYNTPENVARSRGQLAEMGVENFDEFSYVIPTGE
ncbi:MAG: radical SAM protein [Prevotella sp.]|uniref:radical SAM protein n=1 Tax=Prevotella sp. TaxID=59823 RepID=UPI002A2F0DB3|nr:radical SAM protein [Prevotella sp.]MDD7318454.1 radical SAM protein [Prevotellaceae bacterium]MDY4020195.1 radical SAM protein [Prevotella sp.]